MERPQNNHVSWVEGTVKPASSFSTLEKSPDTTSIVDLVERQVERTPDQTALKSRDGAISYKTFNSQANRVAHALIAMGAQRVIRLFLW